MTQNQNNILFNTTSKQKINSTGLNSVGVDDATRDIKLNVHRKTSNNLLKHECRNNRALYITGKFSSGLHLNIMANPFHFFSLYISNKIVPRFFTPRALVPFASFCNNISCDVAYTRAHTMT